MPTLPPAVMAVPSIVAGSESACAMWSAMVCAISRAPGDPSAGRSCRKHEELVAAVARDQVGGSRRPLEPARHLAQQLVSRLVAVRVVHVLEVVQVDVEHRHLAPVPLGAG